MRLAVDGGATGLRIVRLDGSEIVEQADGPGFQWARGGDPVEQQAGLVREVWQRLGEPAPIEVVGIGLAGGAIDPESRVRLARLIADELGAAQVLLTNDDVTNHLGALGGAPGVVIASGTGVACLAVTADGRLAKLDGLGYLFGDAGSGFSIGLAGLRAALSAIEGRGAATELVERAERVAGTPLPLTMRTWYKRPTLTADVAAFAPEVGAASAAADPVAQEICARAGRELATTVDAAVRSSFDTSKPTAVSWSGGVLLSYPQVFDAFKTELATRCPQAELHDPMGDALAGAIRLATGENVPHLAGVYAAQSLAAHPSGDDAP
ncbi:N-acetylglucosamine kinase [Flindersiella endophytica]